MQLLGITSHYPLSRLSVCRTSSRLTTSFTFLTSVNGFPFPIFLRHDNLVLSSFRISDMLFSISFSSSSSSSLILKPNSLFSCRLPVSSTTNLTSFRNSSPPFSLKPKNHCSSSFSLSFGICHVIHLLFFSVFLQVPIS